MLEELQLAIFQFPGKVAVAMISLQCSLDRGSNLGGGFQTPRLPASLNFLQSHLHALHGLLTHALFIRPTFVTIHHERSYAGPIAHDLLDTRLGRIGLLTSVDSCRAFHPFIFLHTVDERFRLGLASPRPAYQQAIIT